jgi:hypothetical protein
MKHWRKQHRRLGSGLLEPATEPFRSQTGHDPRLFRGPGQSGSNRGLPGLISTSSSAASKALPQGRIVAGTELRLAMELEDKFGLGTRGNRRCGEHKRNIGSAGCRGHKCVKGSQDRNPSRHLPSPMRAARRPHPPKAGPRLPSAVPITPYGGPSASALMTGARRSPASNQHRRPADPAQVSLPVARADLPGLLLHPRGSA